MDTGNKSIYCGKWSVYGPSRWAPFIILAIKWETYFCWQPFSSIKAPPRMAQVSARWEPGLAVLDNNPSTTRGNSESSGGIQEILPGVLMSKQMVIHVHLSPQWLYQQSTHCYFFPYQFLSHTHSFNFNMPAIYSKVQKCLANDSVFNHLTSIHHHNVSKCTLSAFI